MVKEYLPRYFILAFLDLATKCMHLSMKTVPPCKHINKYFSIFSALIVIRKHDDFVEGKSVENVNGEEYWYLDLNILS